MGFWSTLGKGLLLGGAAIAAPFTGGASLATVIPAVLAGGSAVLGAAFSGKGKNDGGGSGTAGPAGIQIPPELMASVRAEDPASSQARSFYSTILNGSQDATETLLGPEVNTILSQYDTAAKAAEEFGPRGGGRASVAGEIPFKKVAAYGNLLAGAKPKAAEGLASIGQQKRGTDLNVLQALLSKDTANNQLSLGKDQLQFQKDSRSQDQLGGIGSSIGNILVDLLKGKKGGTSGGGFGKSTGAGDLVIKDNWGSPSGSDGFPYKMNGTSNG